MYTFFMALYQSQRPVTFSLAFWGQGIYLSFSCYRKIAIECKGKQLQMEKYRVGKKGNLSQKVLALDRESWACDKHGIGKEYS